MLRQFLRETQGYGDELSARALHLLGKEAGDTSRSLYDRNKAVYRLLRYGVPVKLGAGEQTETVWLIDWKRPERNHFAFAEEVTVAAPSAKAHTKRPDIVLYVNGIALGVLRSRTILELHVPRGADVRARERILHRWYRAHLREMIPPLLAKWESILGVHAAGWGIRRMKTKWGACNVDARRIWVNLELAKKPPQCIEYLIVHELAHLLDRRHGDAFVSLMDRHLPQWRLHRQTLNAAPLRHESWRE
jgi:hypothetical protein